MGATVVNYNIMLTYKCVLKIIITILKYLKNNLYICDVFVLHCSVAAQNSCFINDVIISGKVVQFVLLFVEEQTGL